MIEARILVVEDEAITAKDIEARLRRMGYDVSGIAHSAAEAMERAEASPPDLVLMDIHLSGDTDGIEAARQLHARFRVPVAYLTAYADDATLARAQDTGPYGYVVKPFGERELHATIQMALHRHSLEKQVEEGQCWLETVLSAVGDAIIATDGEGFVRLMNPVAEALTGWTAAAARGKELAQVFRTAPLPGGAPGTRQPPDQKAAEPKQVLLLGRGGETPIEVSATVARDDTEQITGFVWAFHGIAARRRTEEALREREAHFRSLIEKTSDVILVLDRDGTVYYASPSIERVLGYNPADLLGENALSVVHEDDVGRASQLLAYVGEQEGTIEIRARREDGAWRVLEAAGSRRFDVPQGEHIVVNVRDITERKEAEDKLRQEYAVTEALARVGQETIAALDSSDLLDRLCRVTAEVLKCDFSHTWLWDPEEQVYATVAGHGDAQESWESMRALKVPAAVVSGLMQRLRTEKTAEIVMSEQQQLLPAVLPQKYGITVALYVGLHRGGEMIGVQTAGYRGRRQGFSDQQKRIAEGIGQAASLALDHARLMQELERASRLKSDLMATLSHELRSPLASIAMLSELLLHKEFGSLSPEQEAQMGEMQQHVQRMRELIDTTLDLSRIDRQRFSLDLRATDVAQLLRELAHEAESLARNPGVALEWEVPEELPAVLTDAVKLKVVIKNLVGNALKFTQRGSVEVSAAATRGGIEVEIRDTGIGIPQSAREAIFEPFHQVSAGPPSQGVGLGLYIARRLLEMLGGRISFESREGAGSSFRVWVPEDPRPA